MLFSFFGLASILWAAPEITFVNKTSQDVTFIVTNPFRIVANEIIGNTTESVKMIIKLLPGKNKIEPYPEGIVFKVVIELNWWFGIIVKKEQKMLGGHKW